MSRRTLLNPSHAMFGEARYLLRDDPRTTDRVLYCSVLYCSVLGAVADGASTPGAVAARLGRDARSLAHHLARAYVTERADIVGRSP